MHRLLFVDDNQKLAHFSHRYLELRIPGMAVTCVATCEAARIAAQQRQPDCIVMDWHLPDGGGAPFLEEMHAMAPNAVLLVVTAETPARVQGAARAAGAQTVVGKPYEVDDLVAAVEGALHLTSLEPPTPATSDGEEQRLRLREERHRILNRLAGLLAGLRAFAADLQAEAHDPISVSATVDLYLERLVEAVQEVANRIRNLTAEGDQHDSRG